MKSCAGHNEKLSPLMPVICLILLHTNLRRLVRRDGPLEGRIVILQKIPRKSYEFERIND